MLCREVADDDHRRVKFIKAKQTINSTNEDHYQVGCSFSRFFLALQLISSRPARPLAQKVTTFTRSSPHLLAIGSTNSQLSVITYPALEEVFPPIGYDGEEIFDVDFDDSGLMVRAFPSRLMVRGILIRSTWPSRSWEHRPRNCAFGVLNQ